MDFSCVDVCIGHGSGCVFDAVPLARGLNGLITLSGVSKVFDGKRKATALENISLEIGKGEIVAIVGPSGSGKSTLLNLIGGLDRPTSGDIAIDGEQLRTLNDDNL